MTQMEAVKEHWAEWLVRSIVPAAVVALSAAMVRNEVVDDRQITETERRELIAHTRELAVFAADRFTVADGLRLRSEIAGEMRLLVEALKVPPPEVERSLARLERSVDVVLSRIGKIETDVATLKAKDEVE